MEYTTAKLTNLGSFAALTLGMGGSCLDGGSRNNTQKGGGFQDAGGNNNPGSCGQSL